MGHQCCSKQKVKRGLWSPEEDEKLITHITIHGHTSWSSVPKLAGLQRCGKSCRLRWINYLRPDLRRGSFTEEEERTIIEVHRILGNRWAQIAKHLPGRTDNEVKNFWNSCIKKKLLAQGLDPNTHNLLPTQNKSKTYINNNASKPSNHHRISSNSTSLNFSDDHQSQSNSLPLEDTEMQHTINFECNFTDAQFLAPDSMNKSDTITDMDVDNLCGYIIDENPIWGTTPSLENFEQATQESQVRIPLEETVGVHSDQNFDGSLLSMLSYNYGLGEYPSTNIPNNYQLYSDIGSTMDQVAWCETNSFQSGYFTA
ncbi:unnamed protein product [Amaranthus hypochondriacus]